MKVDFLSPEWRPQEWANFENHSCWLIILYHVDPALPFECWIWTSMVKQIGLIVYFKIVSEEKRPSKVDW